MIVVEKLLFDSNLHHPQVVISESGLKATHPHGCAKYIYAKVSNVAWQNERHYWEVILGTSGGNVSLIIERNIIDILIIFEVVTHRWESLHLYGIQTNV